MVSEVVLPSEIRRNRPEKRSKKATVPKCRVCKSIDSFYRDKYYQLVCNKCGADEFEMFYTKIKWEDY